MDVRCEKCFTVYELDDAKVGDGGLTVKCQECGNLFKVRRRPDTAELAVQKDGPDDGPTTEMARPPKGKGLELPASEQPTGITDRELSLPPSTQARTDEPSPAKTTEETTAASVRSKTVERTMPRAPGEDRGWMLRTAATGEIRRFRELTTLQQWIVERKVTRADEISRGGESWKTLGGIAELASFFHIVEQAEAVAHASQPGLAVQRGARGGSLVVESPASDAGELPTDLLAALPRTGPTMGGPNVADEDDDDDEIPRARGGRGLVAVAVVLTILGAATGGIFLWRRANEARRDPSTSPEAIAELARRGREAMLLDTDESFKEAIGLLDRAAELDPTGLLVRVDLGEAHVTWAAYLLDDAKALETTGGPAGQAAARTLRTDAQAHLERARHVLEEPQGVDAQASPALARAFGDLLRVEGAPAAAAERHLHRAAQKGTDDAELAYALGELAQREGKNDEAEVHLAEATRLGHVSGGLPRADYRLAQLALGKGRKDEAARECETLLKLSPKHERGRALCAAATAPLAVDLGPAPDAATLAPADAAPAPKPAALAPPGTKEAMPSDYKSLVREADHLSENGRSQQARKLYERALELDAKGVAAYTGLGYCDLDAERFMQAVDRFNAALAVDPDAGDAMLGLAESYKIRGQSPRALDWYKKYITAHPDGAKAAMAQKNIREIEHAKESASDKLQERAVEQAIEKSQPEPKKPDIELPRLPDDPPK